MRKSALLCVALLAALAFPACDRHPAERTLAFINAHKKGETHGEAGKAGHETADPHTPAPTPATGSGAEPRPFFPAGH